MDENLQHGVDTGGTSWVVSLTSMSTADLSSDGNLSSLHQYLANPELLNKNVEFQEWTIVFGSIPKQYSCFLLLCEGWKCGGTVEQLGHTPGASMPKTKIYNIYLKTFFIWCKLKIEVYHCYQLHTKFYLIFLPQS